MHGGPSGGGFSHESPAWHRIILLYAPRALRYRGAGDVAMVEMSGYPSLVEIIATIAEIVFFFLFGVIACACVMKGFYWLLEKCDPD